MVVTLFYADVNHYQYTNTNDNNNTEWMDIVVVVAFLN